MKSIKLFYDYRGQDGSIRGASHVKELVNLVKKELQEGKDSSFLCSCINTHNVLSKGDGLKNIKVDKQYSFQSPEQVKLEEIYKWLNLIEKSFSSPEEVDKICERFYRTNYSNCSIAICYQKLKSIDRWLNGSAAEKDKAEENGKEDFNVTVEKMTENETPKTESKTDQEKTENQTLKNEEADEKKTPVEVNKVEKEKQEEKIIAKEETIENKENEKDETDDAKDSAPESQKITEVDKNADVNEDNKAEETSETAETAETAEMVETAETVETVETAEMVETAETVETVETAEMVETAETDETEETEEISFKSLNEIREEYQKLSKAIYDAEIEKDRIIKEALIKANEIKDKATIETNKQIEDAKNTANSIIEDAVKEAVRKKEDAEKEAKRIKEDAEGVAKEEIAKAESNANEKIAQAKVEAQAIKDKAIVDADVYVTQRKKQLESFTAEIESTKKDTNKKAQKTRNETKSEIFKARGNIEDVKKELNNAQSAFGRVGDSINKVGSTLNGISEAIQKAIVSATGKINDIANEIEFKDAERATDLILLIYDQVFAMHNAYENYFVNEDSIHKDDVLDRLAVVEEVIEECLEEYGLSAFSTEKDTVIDTSKHDVSHAGGQVVRTSVIEKSVKKGFVWDNGIVKMKEKVTVKPLKVDDTTETDA